MNFKLSKLWKRKQPKSTSQIGASTPATFRTGTGGQGAKPLKADVTMPSPSTQNFDPALSPHAPMTANEITVSTWPNLQTLSRLLNEGLALSGLTQAIDFIYWFVNIHEKVLSVKREYEILRTQLDGLFKTLLDHFSGSTSPSVTNSMLNLCWLILDEMQQLYGTQDKGKIGRMIEVEHGLDKIMGCYRRIQGHLNILIANTTLDISMVLERKNIEEQLNKLKPLLMAYHNAGKAEAVTQRRECQDSTRVDVLLELEAWKNDKAGEKIFWLSGMAGTGKTTIAKTLCLKLEERNQLGASFFCTRLLPECQDVYSILPTIAYQLAYCSIPFARALSQVLQREPDARTKGLRTQFEWLILEPLQVIGQVLPLSVVVIDALDECGETRGVGELLELFFKYASKLPIKFFLSSRPEYDIRIRIDRSCLKTQLALQEIEEDRVKHDIEIYISKELGSKIQGHQLSSLVKHAGVLFIYATTMVRYIQGGDFEERLATILNTSGSRLGTSNQTRDIDLLYNFVLEMALDDATLEPPEKARRELVLHTAICAQGPLTVDGMAGLLSLTRDQVKGALKPLWSVLHVSEIDVDNEVSPLHASFPEYMLDRKRSGSFSCDSGTHNDKLAKLCFERIERNNPRFNICHLASSHVFDCDIPDIRAQTAKYIPTDLLYACSHWATHLDLSWKVAERRTERTEDLERFFSNSLLLCMEVLNLRKDIDRCVEQMEKAIRWLQKTGCSESLELLARDARRFMTMFAASPISQSTPHLYVSMLASWPTHQPIAMNYAKRAIELPKLEGIKSAERQLALLSKILVGGEVYCVAFSPNSQFFVAGTSKNTILIWDALSCRLAIEPIIGHNEPVQCIAISPDSTQICSGSRDGTICIWNSVTGQLVVNLFECHSDWVTSLAYSLDGLLLASGSGDGTIRIYKTGSEGTVENVLDLEPEAGVIYSVAFSPSATFIAAGCEASIHLWDAHTGHLLGKPLEGHTNDVRAIKFLPDKNHFVSCARDGIRIWDLEKQQMVRGPFGESPLGVGSISISPSGAYIASGSPDCTVRIFDEATLQTRTILWHSGCVEDIAFSSDGIRLVSGSSDSSVCVWDVQGLDQHTVCSQLDGHSDWVRSVAFSACGTYLISGSDDSTIRIWNTESGEQIGCCLGHKGRVLTVQPLVANNHIVSASGDRTICVWDRQTGSLMSHYPSIEVGHVNENWSDENWPVAVSHGGNLMVCGSYGGRLYMWSGTERLFVSARGGAAVHSVAFAPDEHSFVSGHKDGKVVLWDSSSGEQLGDTFTGHSKCVRSVAFSPSGQLVASGSDDMTLRLWNVQDHLQQSEPFRGHNGFIYSISFSPDGKCLISGSGDKTIRIWDIKSGLSVAVLHGHTDPVFSVKFSPDGTQIASGSGDMTIRLWKTPKMPSEVITSTLTASPDGIIDNSGALINRNDTIMPWTMDDDGWVKDSQAQLLLWVPPDLRRLLLRPQNTTLICRWGRIKLNLDNAQLGENWAKCYSA